MSTMTSTWMRKRKHSMIALHPRSIFPMRMWVLTKTSWQVNVICLFEWKDCMHAWMHHLVVHFDTHKITSNTIRTSHTVLSPFFSYVISNTNCQRLGFEYTFQVLVHATVGVETIIISCCINVHHFTTTTTNPTAGTCPRQYIDPYPKSHRT